MTYELSLHKNTGEMMKYFLTKETTEVGRATSNDICLPDPDISRVHLKIQKKGKIYIATDTSSNGTFINGQKISSVELKPGDEIKLGNWKILFKESIDAFEGATQVLRLTPTKILKYKPEHNALVLEKIFLETMQAPNQKIEIEQKLTSIGSAPGNDLCITSDFVSAHHCRIENRDGQFFIKDFGSTNGTLVNGHRVIEAELPMGATLELGPIQIKFFAQTHEETLSESPVSNFEGIYSKNPHMRKIFSLIQKIHASNAPVLIHGETGTGKELIARAIHNQSNRKSAPFVAINCGAISKDLIESELFGHEKGAFTSAATQRKGVFEQAHQGTLFLDEIGELPLDLQPKLLRVLETLEIRRVGGNQTIPVNVRVIAATHRNLAEEIKRNQFREDLFYRLYVIPIILPPLRERPEDIELLCRHFLTSEFSAAPDQSKMLDKTALNLLQTHAWPGNIRELKNVISRALLDAPTGVISSDHIVFAPASGRDLTAFEYKSDKPKPKVSKSLKDIEKEKITEELIKNKWNKLKTAKILGVAKSTLHQKIMKYAIEIPKGTRISEEE